MEQQARTGKANQLWKLQYNGKDAYRLASQSLANSYMYTAMDMDGGSVTAIPSQSDKTATGYEFMIEPVATGYYRVSSKAVSALYALTGGRYDSEDASVYTYTGANDQQWAFEKYTLSLSAAKNWVAAGSTLTLKPSSTVLGIAWSSSNNAVATVKNGIVTGVKPGTATITASAGGATAKYTVTVRNADPFYPDNIEYVRYTRIVGENYGGLGGKTDHTISVVKSMLYTDDYYIARDNINDNYSREYVISDNLVNTLKDLESAYQEHYSIIPAFNTCTENENAAHTAKQETDQLVDNGNVSSGSSEYYGTWAYNYTSLLNLSDYWKGVLDAASSAYQMYLTITAVYCSYLSSTSQASTSISTVQYKDTALKIEDVDSAVKGIKITSKKVISAEERNAALAKQGYTNPYKARTPVIEFSQAQEVKYVRVYTQGKPSR